MRAMQTHLPLEQITGFDIEPRLREQEFGNMQDNNMVLYREEQQRVGRFWYRFPNGESGADVHGRVCSFWNDLKNSYLNVHPGRSQKHAKNVLIVTHGLTMRFLVCAERRWSPDTFETVWNPGNCEMWVLKLGSDDIYDFCDEGSRPRTSRTVLVVFKDGRVMQRTLEGRVNLFPQPDVEGACERLGLDIEEIDHIDFWNGKFKSNFSYGDNMLSHEFRNQGGVKMSAEGYFKL
jgi:broad specificity phosphatase PhoE